MYLHDNKSNLCKQVSFYKFNSIQSKFNSSLLKLIEECVIKTWAINGTDFTTLSIYLNILYI